MRKSVKIGATLFFATAAILVTLAQYYDPARTIYKRLKETSPYVFEEPHPKLAAIDPNPLITLHKENALLKARQIVRNWALHEDGAPWSESYQATDSYAPFSQFLIDKDWDTLGSLTELTLSTSPHSKTYGYVLAPKENPSRKAVLYHHGMASSIEAAEPVLSALLEKGYTIFALNQLGYADEPANELVSPCPKADRVVNNDPALGCHLNTHFEMAYIPHAPALHMRRTVAALDWLEAHGFEKIGALGFSAGAMVVALTAAIDDRIDATVSAAGLYPMYLREGQDGAFGLARAFADKGDYSALDAMIMAASDKRSYLQVFNRYDRCCFANLKGLLYDDAVRSGVKTSGGGAFETVIDETHAEHKISTFGIDQILNFFDAAL